MAKALAARGINAEVVVVGSVPPLVAAHIGNGELFETSLRVFGEPLTRSLWALSRLNLYRPGLPQERCLRFAADEREAGLFRLTASKWKEATLIEEGCTLQ